MKTSKEKYCEHELVPVHECTKCRKTFDVLPSAGDLKENNCPRCGAGKDNKLKTSLITGYLCGTTAGHTFLHIEQSALCAESSARQKAEAEVERLRGQLTRAVSIAGVLLADIEDFHEGDSDDEWTRTGWNDSRISKYLL
jgi:rubredoxin